ncbi:MAG: ABC transporter permease subunit, partial [Deltaproteobacteria bacterium]|nr:ABC transporter permease subunit [Deltaproteobacteria bacterium]
MGLSYSRIKFVRSISWVDVVFLIGLVVFIYAVLGVAAEWAGPFRPKTEIHLGFSHLLGYSLSSLVRVFLAYLLSLVFTLTYGYWAAKSKAAEPILISLLDILQSVPVLGFMPGLVLALVHIFPHSNLGLELAAIVMIFTGEGWNMVFSFYSSLKGVPPEYKEVARLYRLDKWQVLRTVELPCAVNGLLWNSMLSMAGGWFFLMVIESFSLGDQDFRLPGIGSYMAVAYERHDLAAVFAGIGMMFFLIVVVDRCLWAPLVVWSERFRLDQDTNRSQIAEPLVYQWLKRSRLLPRYYKLLQRLSAEIEKRADTQRKKITEQLHKKSVRPLVKVFRYLCVLFAIAFFIWGIVHMFRLLAVTSAGSWFIFIRDTFFTLLRVVAAVTLGSLWTIPVGVFIGTHPRWSRRLQPVVQVVASFPAPMLFPMLTFVLVKMGITLEIGAVLL